MPKLKRFSKGLPNFLGQNIKRNVIMSKLNIGDKVKIVDARNCEFGCNNIMTDYIGQTTTIINEELTPDGLFRIYKIKVDKGRFNWSANCLKLLIKRKSTVIKNE
jgi:hypothetical protein